MQDTPEILVAFRLIDGKASAGVELQDEREVAGFEIVQEAKGVAGKGDVGQAGPQSGATNRNPTPRTVRR